MLETQAFRSCHLSASRHSAITALFIAEYTICAGLKTFCTAKSRCSARSLFPSPCRAHVQSLFAFHSTYDTESHSGRILSLAGRPGIRQFLCSLPRREALVLGDVLVDRRLLQLDHR